MNQAKNLHIREYIYINNTSSSTKKIQNKNNKKSDT